MRVEAFPTTKILCQRSAPSIRGIFKLLTEALHATISIDIAIFERFRAPIAPSNLWQNGSVASSVGLKMKYLLIFSIALTSWSSGFGQELREYGIDDPLVHSYSARFERLLRIAGSTMMPEFEHRLASAQYSARSVQNVLELKSSSIGTAEFNLNSALPTFIEVTPSAYANSITTRLNIVYLTDKAEEIARLYDTERWFLVLALVRQDPERHLVSFEFKKKLRIAPTVGPLSSIGLVSLDDRTGELLTMRLPSNQDSLNIDLSRVTSTYTNAQLRNTALRLFLAIRPFGFVEEGISGLTYSIPSSSSGEDHGYYRGMSWLTNEHSRLVAANTGTLTYEIRLLNAINRNQIAIIRVDAITNSPMSYLLLDNSGLGLNTVKKATEKHEQNAFSCQLRDTGGYAIPLRIVDKPMVCGTTVRCIVELDRRNRIVAEVNVKTGFGQFNVDSKLVQFKADPKRLRNLPRPLTEYGAQSLGKQ